MATHTDPPGPKSEASPSRELLKREALLASLGVLVLLGVVKHIGAFVPFIGEHAFTIAAAAQLYVPIFLIGTRGITRDTLGLSMARWREDMSLVFVLAVFTIVPFGIGHHYWQTELFDRRFQFRLPEKLLTDTLLQIFVVALAEEIYFRGYLQERLERIFPAKRRLLGAPFGAAIILAAAVFAGAHFVGEYRPDRLGPFFPALVFGLLRSRTNTILGAIGYHAFCNVLSEVLRACYR